VEVGEGEVGTAEGGSDVEMSERSEHLSWLRNTRFLCVDDSCKIRNVPYQSKDHRVTVKLRQYGDVDPTWFYACPVCESPLFMTVPNNAKNKQLLVKRQQGALKWVRRNIVKNRRKKERRKKRWQDIADGAIIAAAHLRR